jgi:hypothetical protein
MGLSRDTFYRYRDAVEDGGVEALLERPRRGSPIEPLRLPCSIPFVLVFLIKSTSIPRPRITAIPPEISRVP